MAYNFVIGGGWTVSQWDTRELINHGFVIGVNDAALWTNVHAALTMDRLWFENRWPYLRTRRVAETWVREKCDCNVPRQGKRDNWKTFVHFNKTTPSITTGELHGGNSGTCAINLAFQSMSRGDYLFLLGFDMCRGPGNEPYWYPPYPWTNPEGATKKGHFDMWVRDMDGFASYADVKGLNVFNVTTGSAIHCFPRIEFNHMMGMIK
jgi:hypothetical protein